LTFLFEYLKNNSIVDIFKSKSIVILNIRLFLCLIAFIFSIPAQEEGEVGQVEAAVLRPQAGGCVIKLFCSLTGVSDTKYLKHSLLQNYWNSL
jgi:hypothetical protein